MEERYRHSMEPLDIAKLLATIIPKSDLKTHMTRGHKRKHQLVRSGTVIPHMENGASCHALASVALGLSFQQLNGHETQTENNVVHLGSLWSTYWVRKGRTDQGAP